MYMEQPPTLTDSVAPNHVADSLPREIMTNLVGFNDQLNDIFTKSLRGPRVDSISNKFGAYDIYAPD